MLSNNSMGRSFIWFQGVVEDRNDPLRLGRLKVRCLGFHTDDKEKLPTKDLPWAYPIQPITSAAMNGIGTTPFGPIEGTWVMGFFRDGDLGQEPVVMGTIGGIPQDISRPEKGFNDPYGNYPRPDFINEPDTNRLARAEAEDHPILKTKLEIAAKEIDIPIAKAHKVTSVLPDKDDGRYDDKTWAEPTPRGDTKSKYPFNSVHEAEGGHVREIDSTPDAERIHEYHSAGSFYEIQADGKKITKVVSDNYEIILGDNFIKINGNANIVIGGDCTQLVKGNLIQEIQGDYHLTVHGDKVEKVTGSSVEEISTDRSNNIGGNDYQRVGKKKNQFVTDTYDKTIGGDSTTVIRGSNKNAQTEDLVFSTSGKMTIIGGTGLALGTGGPLEIAGAQTMTIKSTAAMIIESTAAMTIESTAAMTINSDSTIESTSTGMTINNDVDLVGTLDATVDVKAGAPEVTLKTHKHTGVTAGGALSGGPVAP